jgi:hypothetical protein
MDSLTYSQALIIAIFFGLFIAYSYGIKQPFHIALIIVIIFIVLAMLFEHLITPLTTPGPLLTPMAPSLAPSLTPAVIMNKSAISSDEEDEGLPFDNLQPQELMNRLNFIYTQTSNPLAVDHHQGDITSMDKLLTRDNASLSSANSDIHLVYADWLYPQLTAKQINTRDCTNYEKGEKSCIQSPDKINEYPISDCAKYNVIPVDNVNRQMELSLLKAAGKQILESFTNINTNSSKDKIMYYNAQNVAMNKRLCRNCKTGVCKHDICM